MKSRAKPVCPLTKVHVKTVNSPNCRITLINANGRKLLGFNRLSPIGLLPGVSLTWSYCQKSWNKWHKIESDILR